MKKEIFFVASPDIILPVEKVKAIMDYEADVSKKIVKNQIEENVRNICRKNQKRRCVIWMHNNVFYLTSVSVDTIYERINKCGRKFIKVGRGFYLPVDNIEGVFAFDSTLAVRIRKESELLRTKFNFVRQPTISSKNNSKVFANDGLEVTSYPNSKTKKKKGSRSTTKRHSTILLTSGENISTVYNPETIISRTHDVSNAD